MSLTVVDKSMILSVSIAAAFAIAGLLTIPSNTHSSFDADAQIVEVGTLETLEAGGLDASEVDASVETRPTMIMLMESDGGVATVVPQFIGPEQDSGVNECL